MRCAKFLLNVLVLVTCCLHNIPGTVFAHRLDVHALQVHEWVPTLEDSSLGFADLNVPDNVTATITLYKEPRAEAFEDKDWTLYVETVSQKRHCMYVGI